LFGGRTCLPIAHVGNETGVFTVVGVVVESRSGWSDCYGWIKSWRSRAGPVGARPILAAVAAMIWAISAPTPLRAAHSRKANIGTCRSSSTLSRLSRAVGVGRYNHRSGLCCSHHGCWRGHDCGTGPHGRDSLSCAGDDSCRSWGCLCGDWWPITIRGNPDFSTVPELLRLTPSIRRKRRTNSNHWRSKPSSSPIVITVPLGRTRIPRDVIPLDQHQLAAQIRGQLIPVVQRGLVGGEVGALGIGGVENGTRIGGDEC